MSLVGLGMYCLLHNHKSLGVQGLLVLFRVLSALRSGARKKFVRSRTEEEKQNHGEDDDVG